MNDKADLAVESLIERYVVESLPLGIYDPNQPKRARVPVVSFEVEFVEVEDDGVAHAAGPVVLRTPKGDVEQHLRVSLPLAGTNGDRYVADGVSARAVYVVLTNEENGACKETAALANA